MQTSFDILGDVHGQLDALTAILDQLGYQRRKGVYFAPTNRQLISVGDVINKGPYPLECLELIADMVKVRQAQMIIGNHEINAIHYQAGFRARNAATTKQFSPTLAQIEKDSSRWQRMEEFILSLPNRLELDSGRLRVVHAHWPNASFPHQIDSTLVEDSGLGGPLHADLQEMVKGPEAPSEPYVDRQGYERTRDRIRWWDTYPEDEPFIAFGHYCFPWPHEPSIPNQPTLLGPGKNAACLDFGAGNGDRLVALRYPEMEFVTVHV
ncbi:MAG: hypothetical protein ACI97A_001900 [Planctomycetota bacterium]